MDIIDGLLERVGFLNQGQVLARYRDDWGMVMIIDHDDFRILKFDSLYEQSRMRKSRPEMPVHNYIKAMLLSLAFNPVNSVLILGLGGGALVRAIHHYDSEIIIKIIELRRTVIEVACELFHIPLSSKIAITEGDAATYISRKNEEKHNLIFADLYWALEMDPTQAEHGFLLSCRDKLTQDGWLVINYHEIPDVDSPLFFSLRELFADILMCIVPSGNVIIYASQKRCARTLEWVKNNAENIGCRLHVKMDSLSKKIVRLSDS